MTVALDSPGVFGADRAEEKRLIRKVAYRLIPFLGICYFFAYLDRVNLGFAALTMNKEFNFSPTVFSMGAGIFFIGYFLFEVPSNIALEKFGARRWIGRIMISWGILSALMAYIGGTYSFYFLRFLIGVAEAGFFPGIVLYLTYWFPAEYRARILAAFIVAVPLSAAIGSPISGMLLGMDGVGGLKGWQWLFVLEGIPSIILGVVSVFYLTDGPQKASWLTDAEKSWLTRQLEMERLAKESVRKLGFGETISNPDIWGLSIIYFGLVAALYGAGFWLPQIVKAFGVTNSQTGFLTAIPYLFSVVAMIIWSRNSDRSRERVWHVVLPMVLTGVALAASASVQSPQVVMIALTLATIGIYAGFALFWTLPSAILTGTAAAGGIALINSIGNLAGFAGPYAVGWFKETTGEVSTGLMVISVLPLISAVLVLVFGRVRRRELEAGESPNSPNSFAKG